MTAPDEPWHAIVELYRRPLPVGLSDVERWQYDTLRAYLAWHLARRRADDELLGDLNGWRPTGIRTALGPSPVQVLVGGVSEAAAQVRAAAQVGGQLAPALDVAVRRARLGRDVAEQLRQDGPMVSTPDGSDYTERQQRAAVADEVWSHVVAQAVDEHQAAAADPEPPAATLPCGCEPADHAP